MTKCLDTDGHLWVLDGRARYYRYEPLPWSWWRTCLAIVFVLVPFFGWVALAVWLTERACDAEVPRGWDEEWYCSRCREREARRVMDEPK